MIEIPKEHYRVFVKEELDFEITDNALLVNHYSANPYGDWVGIAVALRQMVKNSTTEKKLKLIEVGTAHGHFLRTFHEFVQKISYNGVISYGVDSQLHGYCPCQFTDGMHFVEGNSTNINTLNKFKDEDFDFVFIDGCHCEGHAFTDATHWSKKVAPGGYLGFHDTSPTFQGGTEQPRSEGCSEDTHIGVVKGIDKWNPEANGFELVVEEFDTTNYWGGIRVYKRVK